MKNITWNKSWNRNNKNPILPSACDLEVEVVALDVMEDIDGEVVVWVVFFDGVAEVDGKSRLGVEETEGNCFIDDTEDEGRGEERNGFGRTAENRRNMKTSTHKGLLLEIYYSVDRL